MTPWHRPEFQTQPFLSRRFKRPFTLREATWPIAGQNISTGPIRYFPIRWYTREVYRVCFGFNSQPRENYIQTKATFLFTLRQLHVPEKMLLNQYYLTRLSITRGRELQWPYTYNRELDRTNKMIISNLSMLLVRHDILVFPPIYAFTVNLFRCAHLNQLKVVIEPKCTATEPTCTGL